MAGGTGRGVGRPLGGDSTRAQILQVARRVFADKGYAGASLRGVAVAAGVDPSTVVHFFATKQGLFRAAVQEATHALEPAVRALVHDGSGRDVARAYFAAYEDPTSGPALLAVMRTALGSTDASSVVDQVVLQQVASSAVPERRLGVELAMGTLVGIVVARHLGRMPHLLALSVDELAGLVGPQLDALLAAPAPDEGPLAE